MSKQIQPELESMVSIYNRNTTTITRTTIAILILIVALLTIEILNTLHLRNQKKTVLTIECKYKDEMLSSIICRDLLLQAK